MLNSCPVCGDAVPQPDGPGRPRTYCGRRCQSRAERRRSGAYQKAGRVLVDEMEGQMRAIEDEGTVPGAQIRVFGGWNNAATKHGSPSLRRRAALADLEHDRELAVERQAASAAADAQWEQTVFRLAQEAVEDGRIDSIREGIRNPGLLGRTRAEISEMVWSYWDAYDVRQNRAAEKAYAAWLEEQGTAWDSSAPTAAEISAAEADRLLEDQRQLQRGRQIGKQQQFRAMRSIAQQVAVEEIALDRADPGPVDALLTRAQRRGRGRRG